MADILAPVYPDGYKPGSPMVKNPLLPYATHYAREGDWHMGGYGLAIRDALPTGTTLLFGNTSGQRQYGMEFEDFETGTKWKLKPTGFFTLTTAAARIAALADNANWVPAEFIAEDEAGEEHPAFSSERAAILWLLANRSAAPVVTTPDAPTLTADDTADTLSAAHPLGASEILVSTNGSTYVAYAGPITVGDVARAAGYWKFKTRAAVGRNESPVAESPAFNVAPVESVTITNVVAS
ncbi:hypothetical protein [Hymenobacter sp. B81]|uniref:hypothetical protein n=1 Tax=Hymenobacter sp. B81 TaxID=3344878 RepID=UPI0037DCFFF9